VKHERKKPNPDKREKAEDLEQRLPRREFGLFREGYHADRAMDEVTHPDYDPASEFEP
jgi:hypothetical protein